MNTVVQKYLAGIGVFFACLCMGPAFSAGAETRINNIRFGLSDDGGTRVVIDSDTALGYQHFVLESGSYRLVLDMPRVVWGIRGKPSQSGRGWGRGLVERYRYAHGSPAMSRLVFDLAGPVGIARHFRLPPRSKNGGHRLVFDLEKVSRREFVVQAARPPITDTSSSADKTEQKPLIVIDPGHGGKDPGASGLHGSKEKDITLSIAKSLARKLKRSGRYRVRLTRERDEFLELEARVDRAREFRADLFISLHADAGRDRNIRGASVYTLSSKGARRADRIRRRQDWVLPVETDNRRPNEVKGVLVDLITRETKSQSALFAQKLIPALKMNGWPSLRRTHRSAGFFVLLAPDVPAILLEMGFLTNAEDEALLTSRKRRLPLLRAIVRSIDAFFRERDDLRLAER